MMRARLGTDSVPGSRLHTCGKLELVIVVCLVTTNTLAKLHDGKKERHLKIIAIGDNFATMMGLDSAYLGTFGNDARGDFARRTLIELGVDLSHSLQYDGPNAFTTMKITTGKRHQIVGEPVQELQLSRDVARMPFYLQSRHRRFTIFQRLTMIVFSKRLPHRLIWRICRGRPSRMMMWRRCVGVWPRLVVSGSFARAGFAGRQRWWRT